MSSPAANITCKISNRQGTYICIFNFDSSLTAEKPWVNKVVIYV